MLTFLLATTAAASTLSETTATVARDFAKFFEPKLKPTTDFWLKPTTDVQVKTVLDKFSTYIDGRLNSTNLDLISGGGEDQNLFNEHGPETLSEKCVIVDEDGSTTKVDDDKCTPKDYVLGSEKIVDDNVEIVLVALFAEKLQDKTIVNKIINLKQANAGYVGEIFPHAAITVQSIFGEAVGRTAKGRFHEHVETFQTTCRSVKFGVKFANQVLTNELVEVLLHISGLPNFSTAVKTVGEAAKIVCDVCESPSDEIKYYCDKAGDLVQQQKYPNGPRAQLEAPGAHGARPRPQFTQSNHGGLKPVFSAGTPLEGGRRM